MFGAALITDKRVMEVESAQIVKVFIKSSYKDKLHNCKEKLVVKRDSFSVMSALMYNIKSYEIENNV